MGRPSEYSEQIAAIICERLADGESLRSICLSDVMPAKASVFKWLTLHKEFADQYARAREAQAEALADEIVALSDDKSGDTEPSQWGEVGNSANVQRSKLQIDARKWVASKLLPKKYGDKIQQEISGELSLADLIAEGRARANGIR